MLVDDAKAIKQRKIVKTKKRDKGAAQAHKKEDEEEKEIMNAELELEDSGSDDWEDVEEVVQRADSDEEELGEEFADKENDWEDDDSEEAEKGMQIDSAGQEKKEKGKIWDQQQEPLQEGEELEYDGSAY